MDCVLGVLRGEPVRPDVTSWEWQHAFQVAVEEKVLPYFAAKLRQSGAALPEPIMDYLMQAEQETARNSFWWVSELKGILQGFATEAIPVIPLKGPMLAERIYGSTNLRVSVDLDLLVRSADIESSCTLLVKLGFTEYARPSDYHFSWSRGTTLVELHFDVENPLTFNFDTAAAWSRAKQRDFLGQPVWQFAPSDELLFVCLHGVRHRFEFLSNVLDLVLAFRCLTPEIDSKVYEIGTAAKLRPLIVLSRAMAMRLDPRCTFGPDISVPVKTAAHMERVANKLWADMLKGPSTVSNWRIQHRFYLEIETSIGGRLQRSATDIWILATRLTQLDFDFAASYGIHRTVLVWMLRQLRLLAQLCRLGPVTE
ncbi:MAG: nucleotidyltransferase family protein [Terracidiphilus sp.]